MPEDHEDRMEVWDAEIRDRYWDMGFHEGLVFRPSLIDRLRGSDFP